MTINAWGSDDPAEVAKGGTGRNTLTNNALLIGKGTSPVDFVVLTDGQVPIGTTGGPPTGATINGTPNEIDVTSAAGSITIGIADNAILPGTGAYTWVDGTTAQQPAGSNGQTRYDTTTNKFRGYENGAWVDFITSSSGGVGSWVHLNTQTISSPVTTVQWNNTYITSTYGTYAVLFRGVYIASGGAAMIMELSNDNGSTFHNTNYASQAEFWAGPYTQGNSGSYFYVCGAAAGWAAAYPASGQVFLCDLTDAGVHSNGYSTSRVTNSVPRSQVYRATSIYLTAEANDAIRFSCGGVNITAGEFALYGIRNS